MSLARVTSLFGCRDAQNFRQSIAPRLGLPILLLGNRWFAPTEDVNRVLGALVEPAVKTQEKQD